MNCKTVTLTCGNTCKNRGISWVMLCYLYTWIIQKPSCLDSKQDWTHRSSGSNKWCGLPQEKVVWSLPSFFHLQAGILTLHQESKNILIVFTLNQCVYIKWSDDNEPDMKLNLIVINIPHEAWIPQTMEKREKVCETLLH